MERTVEQIVSNSADVLYALLEGSSEILGETLTTALEKGVEQFGLPVNINSRRLFKPVYWVLIKNYAIDFFEKVDGEHVLFWKLRDGGLPDKEEFKRMVLNGYEIDDKKHTGYRTYLEENLELALQSSS